MIYPDLQGRRPIFQMKLGIDPVHGPGWRLGDEPAEDDIEESYSPAFSIVRSWVSDVAGARYVLPGEIKGETVLFEFQVDSGLLVFRHRGVVVRFATHSTTFTPPGLDLPYIGTRYDVLERYGKHDFSRFVQLMPLDIITMDTLYLEDRMAFVGVTVSFGPHQENLTCSGIR